MEEVVAQELTLHIPEDAPVNRVLWLAMSLWWHDGVNFSPLSLDAGEWQQVTETLVKISEVILQAPTVEEMEDVGNTFATGFHPFARGLPHYSAGRGRICGHFPLASGSGWARRLATVLAFHP